MDSRWCCRSPSATASRSTTRPSSSARAARSSAAIARCICRARSRYPTGARSPTSRLYFTPGKLGFPVFDVAGVKVGVQICHDRNFPEGYRVLALRGAELVFTPTNMPVVGKVWQSDIWETTLCLRAYENGFFHVGVGKSGRGGRDAVRQ